MQSLIIDCHAMCRLAVAMKMRLHRFCLRWQAASDVAEMNMDKHETVSRAFIRFTNDITVHWPHFCCQLLSLRLKCTVFVQATKLPFQEFLDASRHQLAGAPVASPHDAVAIAFLAMAGVDT